MPIFYDHDAMKLKVEEGSEQKGEAAKAMLKEVRESMDRLKELCTVSVYPLRCCGRRVNCCSLMMRSLFHEDKQMGIVLRKSFNGTHVWIPSIAQQLIDSKTSGLSDAEIELRSLEHDKGLHQRSSTVKIDAMFFAANEQKLNLDGAARTTVSGDNEGENAPETDFKDYDTMILCNPNAMTYQNMINYPHAYYLKYFLNKKINCLVWNYRGYGRTSGVVSPDIFKIDAEQVLNFLKLRIGVKGKIGVYGRSLGCIAVCHLQD